MWKDDEMFLELKNARQLNVPRVNALYIYIYFFLHNFITKIFPHITLFMIQYITVKCATF